MGKEAKNVGCAHHAGAEVNEILLFAQQNNAFWISDGRT